jgi:16S rRNA (guanine1516-N2)-methyltransferase
MSCTTPCRIGVLAEDSRYAEVADELARRIGVVAVRAEDERSVHEVSLRVVVGSEICVYSGHGRNERRIAVDFSAPALQQRVQTGSKDLLIRACGLHKENHRVRRVMDATAGFGNDAWVLAATGVEVIAVEQDPLVGALLRSALNRACSQGLAASERLTLYVGDAKELNAPAPIDVVYLDPMFSAGRRKAASSKSMSFLQDWLHDKYSEQDQQALFERARDVALARVVVKRSAKAEPLSSYPPTFQIKGKTHRFDVYQLGNGSA